MTALNCYDFTSPRPLVEIHLPDGRTITGPRGSSIGDFLKLLESDTGTTVAHDIAIDQGPHAHTLIHNLYFSPIVGAVINGELRELTYPIDMEAEVRPITMDDTDGMRIYRRSLTFVLEVAFEELFSEAILTIDHSVSSGGYYCQVIGKPTFSAIDLGNLEMQMRKLVEADLPFIRSEVPLQEAIQYFKDNKMEDKVSLLAHRHKAYLTLYKLAEHCDYHHGYMVPSTGYVRWFALTTTGEGFTLRFPRRSNPTELAPLPEYPKLLAAFRQYGDWLFRLGIASTGALNDAILEQRSREIILVSEALHEQQIADIADLVAERINHVHIILISGPSCSGKTTFSKRLTIQLLAHGISPFPLEIDNYFLDRDKTPCDENGVIDFESIRALDLTLLEKDINQLIAGVQVQMPHYNFKTGSSEPGDIVQLQPGQIIILEGIHGLNPGLIPDIPAELTFRIYVSALTQLNLDRHNRVSTTDTRLLRRIVRDARERGYSAQDTIQRWESVQNGEKNNIFPYQENADVIINSALVYELAVLKPLAEPLLRQVPYGTPEHIEAKRLLAFLEWFEPLESDQIPDNSIIREFIGGSILRDFKLWHHDTNGK